MHPEKHRVQFAPALFSLQFVASTLDPTFLLPSVLGCSLARARERPCSSPSATPASGRHPAARNRAAPLHPATEGDSRRRLPARFELIIMVKKTAEKSYGGMAARTSSSELLENNPRQNFRLGDITWVKHGGSSWWPAQVIDEASVSSKPKKKTSHDALVRLYGTCEYLYVDPWKSKMEFEMILKEENKAPMEAFHEVLQKELTHFKSPSDHDEEPVSTKAKTSVKKVRKREGLKRSGHGGVKELATTKGSGDEREHQYSADQDQEVWSNATTGVAVQEGKKKKGARQASPSVSRSQHKKGSVDGTHREIKGMVRDILLGDTIARQHAAEMACVDDVVFGIYDATEGKTTLCTTADTEGGRSVKRTGGGLEADSSNAGKRPRKENNSKGNDSKSSPSREGAMGGCEQHSARQIKIMQKLGLVAPSGSPFKRLVAAAHR